MLDHRRRTTRRTALFADTSEDDSPRRIPYYSLSRFVLLSPPSFSLSLFLSPSLPLSLSLSLSFSRSLTLHAAFMEPRFRFQTFPLAYPAKDLQITGNEYQRRISEVLSVGQGRAARPRRTPFSTNSLFTRVR